MSEAARPADAEERAGPPGEGPRPPSMLDAVLPIVVLIGLLALTIALFGIDATNGPLQVALLLSAAFASLIAFKNGYTVAAVADAAVGGVTSAMGAIFILLAVGALIGTWNMAGTIPTVVHYGIGWLSPTWFYFAAALICALVGMITGSSWTTAGTLGVAFVGMANIMGLNEAIAAGAVICGAYFGDKMTPLSETTILVPKLVGGGLTVGTHIQEHVLDRRPGPRDQPGHLPVHGHRGHADHGAAGELRRRAGQPGRHRVPERVRADEPVHPDFRCRDGWPGHRPRALRPLPALGVAAAAPARGAHDHRAGRRSAAGMSGAAFAPAVPLRLVRRAAIVGAAALLLAGCDGDGLDGVGTRTPSPSIALPTASVPSPTRSPIRT